MIKNKKIVLLFILLVMAISGSFYFLKNRSSKVPVVFTERKPVLRESEVTVAPSAESNAVPAFRKRKYISPGDSLPPSKWIVDREKRAGSTHASITDAIISADDGDSIDIRSGVYNEILEIQKSIILRGLPDGEGNIGVTISSPVSVQISKGSVALYNLIFMSKDCTTIVLQDGSLIATNIVAFTGGEKPPNSVPAALSIREKAKAFIQASFFSGFRGIEQVGGTLNCKDCETSDNMFEGVLVVNNQADLSSWFTNLKSNRNKSVGFAALQNARVRVDGCEINENVLIGLNVAGKSEARLSKCTVANNKRNGVMVAGESFLLFDQGKASNNGFSGIAAAEKSRVTIKRSELSNNGAFGYLNIDDADIAEELNVFSKNREGSTNPHSSNGGIVPAQTSKDFH